MTATVLRSVCDQLPHWAVSCVESGGNMTAHAGVCVLIAVFVITEAAPDTSTWIRSPPQQVFSIYFILHLNFDT